MLIGEVPFAVGILPHMFTICFPYRLVWRHIDYTSQNGGCVVGDILS